MAGDRREFGLQIDVAAKQSASQAFGKPCTHSGFIVMLGLAGRIDTPKTLLDRKRDEALGVSSVSYTHLDVYKRQAQPHP